MITKLSSIDTEASPNEDKRQISQDLQMMHDKTMESFPQLPVRDCVKPSDESYDMRMESQPESPSQGEYKTLVKSLRSTDETQRVNDDTVREPPPAHDKASVSDDILRESPHAHDQESVCDVGLRELPHTPYQDSVCDVGLRELPHTQNQALLWCANIHTLNPKRVKALSKSYRSSISIWGHSNTVAVGVGVKFRKHGIGCKNRNVALLSRAFVLLWTAWG